jgi:hypothetical protein
MLLHDKNGSRFVPAVFLAHAGLGQRIVELKAGEHFFSQGTRQTRVFSSAWPGKPYRGFAKR